MRRGVREGRQAGVFALCIGILLTMRLTMLVLLTMRPHRALTVLVLLTSQVARSSRRPPQTPRRMMSLPSRPPPTP